MPLELSKRLSDNIAHFTGREWLLPRILSWLDQTTERMFILQGAPGSGKSMISAWLSGAGPEPADEDTKTQLRRIRSLIKAVHFCIEDSDNIEPRTLAQNLAEQLSLNVEGFSDALAATVADQIEISSQINVGQIQAGGRVTGVNIGKLDLGALGDELSFSRIFREPLKKLYEDGYDKPMILVVDALDEAVVYKGSLTIVRLLAKLTNLPELVRILVTTRPDPRVLKHYQGVTPFDVIEDAPDREHDVRDFALERLSQFDDELRQRLADRIAKVADGCFLYAHLVLADLLPRLPTPDVEKLRLPKDLSALYDAFLDRELGTDQSEDRWFSEFKPLLGLIAVSQGQGLTQTQLSRITGKDVEASLRICKQYLDGELPEGPFRLFHKSFVDFLLQDKENVHYHIDAAAMHNRIADYYLKKFAHRWKECEEYGIRYLPVHLYVPVHLTNAQEVEDERVILLDFDWLEAKLAATNIHEVIDDFLLSSEAISRVRSALSLSAHILAIDKSQLRSQLSGRLLSERDENIQRLRQQIDNSGGDSWLRPLTPSLTGAGGPLWATLGGHDDSVMDVALTPDAHLAISASADHTLKIWDVFTGAERCTLLGHENQVLAVSVTADGTRAVSASSDETLKVWDLMAEREVASIDAQHGFILNARMAITPDGRKAISASWDETLKVWDLENGENLGILRGHTDYVSFVNLLPNGKVISASDDGTLRLWDLERGESLMTLEGHTKKITAMAISQDGKLAFSASEDYTLRIWDLLDGKEIARIEDVWFSALNVLPDGRHLILASGKNLFCWNPVEPDDSPIKLPGHSELISSIAVSPSIPSLVVTASWDHTLKIWDLERAGESAAGVAHDSSVNTVAAFTDGKRALSCSRDNTLKLWDIATGATLQTFTLADHAYPINAVGVAQDGKLAISASNDMTLKVWEMETGAEIYTLHGHTDFVQDVAITPDGRKAVSAAGKAILLSDCTLKVWNLETGAELHTLSGHTHAVYAVDIAPDGRHAVSASEDGTLKIWDLEEGKLLRGLRGHHDGGVWSVAVTPDGKYVVSGSHDGSLTVWDFFSGDELHSWQGHKGVVSEIAVTPDSQRVISASWDKSLKVWNLKGGEQIASFIGESSINSCSVAPDGMTILSGEASGIVHFLRLEETRGKSVSQL